MKYFFCVCFLAVIFESTALTDDQARRLNAISTSCKAESGVSGEVILRARNGVFVDDPQLKKQILCVAKGVGLATQSGETNVSTLRKLLKKVAQDDQEVDRIVAKCVVEKDTPEDTAFEIAKCVLKEKPSYSPID